MRADVVFLEVIGGYFTGHCVGIVVAIIQGVCPRRFRHHHIFLISGGHVLEHAGEVFGGAMPERVVGAGEHIVIHIVVAQLFGVSGVGAGFLRVGEMNDDLGFGEHFAYGFGTCGEYFGHAVPAGDAGDFRSGFVADLHHADVHAGLFERGQSLLGVVVYGVGGFVRVAFKGFPRLGHLLLAGVGPEIGVMEVDQHFQPCCRGSLGHGQCAIGVDVAAAISLAVCGERIVPHTQTHIVHAGFLEQREQILDLAIGVLERDAAFFQREHG